MAKRFQLNPVEVTIFTAVSGLFFYSVYHLFHDEQGFQAAALAPTTVASSNTGSTAGNAGSPDNPGESGETVASASGTSDSGRAPASVAPLFANFEVPCNEVITLSATKANKIRLSGKQCGKEGASKWINTQVVNSANQFTATVFNDRTAQKYSTDYIPLNAGKNPIKIIFVYSGGQPVTKEIEITKN